MGATKKAAVSTTENDPVLLLMRELVTELRALRAELRAGRERKVKTRRVRAVRRAAAVAEVPVSDIAAAAARRALARLPG